jgi:hypothetical protein
VGFLTVVHEASGYLGGYLVTNNWGRPLEFRISSAVQPNRVQQILYAGTLESYLHADLIGRTLVEKTGVAVQLLVTDRLPVLDLRLYLETPVVWLARADDPSAAALLASEARVRPASALRPGVVCHPRHPEDVAVVGELLERLKGLLDLSEPFLRIQEAMSEFRKLHVARAAA